MTSLANCIEHTQRSQREANMQMEHGAHQSRMLLEDHTDANSPNLPDGQPSATLPSGSTASPAVRRLNSHAYELPVLVEIPRLFRPLPYFLIA